MSSAPEQNNVEQASSLLESSAPAMVPSERLEQQNINPAIETADADFFTARDIARATGQNKKAVHRAAERDRWPSRINGNRLEYQPPRRIARLVIAAPPADRSPTRFAGVRFADLSHSDSQRELVLLREKAVLLLNNNLHLGKETALQFVCAAFKTDHPIFRISISSLRRWDAAYIASGIDGLVEQKRGIVGRKSFAADLSEEDILRAKAASVDHGIRGRQNIASAFRHMVGDPTITGASRAWLHGDRASKSSVPPSVRTALRVAPLATKLIQVGQKAAKLDGPYTECSYENVSAGRAFTADDMTANAYVWVEWPNEQGFLLIRPQILAAMDIGSMAWLAVRAVIRPKGQYTKDDVWGLIGDVLDNGLHLGADGKIDMIAVLEGGIWQSNIVRGHKTGFDDSTRFGGLKSLGVKLIHTRTPRGKIIEGAFNVLQHAADNIKGYCGRDERDDCPEETKRNLALVRSGHAHPRGLFPHLDQYVEHLTAVMKSLNLERNDGKILRGMAPVDKWAKDNPQFGQLPDSSKWMYRAAYRIEQVTRNGIRITVGSGKFQKAYTYANPEVLENHRGRRVLIYWNDYDPDTDAVIYSLRNGKPDKFICVASRVPEIPRFGATGDQMEAEATRKKLSAQLAVTQARSLAPYLQRRWKVGQASSLSNGKSDSDIAEKIQRARAAADERNKKTARIRKTVQRVEVSEEFEQAADESLARRPEVMDEKRIEELLGESPI